MTTTTTRVRTCHNDTPHDARFCDDCTRAFHAARELRAIGYRATPRKGVIVTDAPEWQVWEHLG